MRTLPADLSESWSRIRDDFKTAKERMSAGDYRGSTELVERAVQAVRSLSGIPAAERAEQKAAAVREAASGGDCGPPKVKVADAVDWLVDQEPFDLLLTLVLREELPLREVDLAEVIVAFVENLAARGELDLEACGEFLILISALLELKAR